MNIETRSNNQAEVVLLYLYTKSNFDHRHGYCCWQIDDKVLFVKKKYCSNGT